MVGMRPKHAASAAVAALAATAGMPLYRFAGDGAKGQANGEGIQSVGGTWHVVTAKASSGASAPAPAPAPTTTNPD